jgi:hypothetical protein
MVDVKLFKAFKKESTGELVYVLSLKLEGDRYYNLTVTKSEFEKIYNKISSIYNNNEF